MLRELVEFKVPREKKLEELRTLVQNISTSDAAEKFLIFTEYRGTVAFLENTLQELYGKGCVGVIMGGMGADARKDSIQRFRDAPDCRFSSEQISDLKSKGPIVSCTVNRGGAVIMKSLLLHSSSPATNPSHRRVLHLEFASESLPEPLEWIS